MIWLFFSLSFAGCDKELTSSDITEYRVAQTIERLGERDGRIFGAIINGYKYRVIARHFGVSLEYVLEVKRKGLEDVWLQHLSSEHSP